MVVSSRSLSLVSVAEKMVLSDDPLFSSKFHATVKPPEIEQIFQITKTNMQSYYDSCGDESWKWDDDKKLKELCNKKNRFIVEKNSETIVGFISFRFMVDCGDPVAYVWEIQVTRVGEGLGTSMMDKLENFLKSSTGIRKIVLTVLRNNTRAIDFYEKRKYGIDKSSPQSGCYIIMSKKIYIELMLCFSTLFSPVLVCLSSHMDSLRQV
jgi:ribosomal protein S18 acetylase RimI-like enzyme